MKYVIYFVSKENEMKIQTTNYGLCSVKKQKYQNNGNLALILVDETGQPVSNISTNVFTMGENEFCANCYNMGATLWNDIITSGLFEQTGEKVPSGFCEYPVCKLLVEID
jgi:hypothetical protein